MSSCKKNENNDPVIPLKIIGVWIDNGSDTRVINNRFTINSTSIIWYQWVEGFTGNED